MGQEKNDHETVGGAHGSGEGTHESVAGHCEYVKGHHGSVRRTRLHTFVVCAYKESPYLRECIRSLCDQTVRSRIVISTSTPNASIRGIAEEYGLKIAVNERGMGIADDWNYALQQANTPLVTLAHQDDVYESNYTQRVLKAFRKDRNAIIFFTDYWERRRCSREASVHDGNIICDADDVRDADAMHDVEAVCGGGTVHDGDRRRNEDVLQDAGDERTSHTGWKLIQSPLIKTKQLMLLPLRCPLLQKSRWVRRRILSLGNPICCPSVTYVKKKIPVSLFDGDMKSNIDWQAWEVLSREKGSFVYLPSHLMQHRIHDGSTTAELVEAHARKEEDLYMFRKFWPGKIPELIWKLYGTNERFQ